MPCISSPPCFSHLCLSALRLAPGPWLTPGCVGRLLIVCGILWLPVSTHATSSIGITPDGTTVFVVNPDSGSVTAIDTASETKRDELRIGRDPRILAVGPDGQQLYVTSQASATLTILDTQPFSIRTKLRVGPEPYGVVADPTGHLAYTWLRIRRRPD